MLCGMSEAKGNVLSSFLWLMPGASGSVETVGWRSDDRAVGRIIGGRRGLGESWPEMLASGEVADGPLRVGQVGLQDSVVDFESPVGLPEAPNFLVLPLRIDCEFLDFLVTGSVFAVASGGRRCFPFAGVAHKGRVQMDRLVAERAAMQGVLAVEFRNFQRSRDHFRNI